MVAPIINGSDNSCNPLLHHYSNAGNLRSDERKILAIQALAKQSPITAIANRNNISRKFVYEQKKVADQALDQAFKPVPKEENVLFYLPVTKKLIRQFVLALILICH